MLEADIAHKELTLTEGILNFNQRVTEQITTLERDVKSEITGLNAELTKEEERRCNSDKLLLDHVNIFLKGL